LKSPRLQKESNNHKQKEERGMGVPVSRDASCIALEEKKKFERIENWGTSSVGVIEENDPSKAGMERKGRRKLEVDSVTSKFLQI